MSNKFTAFYRKNVSVELEFSGASISSDSAMILLERLERKNNLIEYFSNFIPDRRDPIFVKHSLFKLLKQRVLLLMHGYEDCNDVSMLKNDPVIKHILEGDLASQPTLSRFENRLNKSDIFALSYAWIDKYVSSLNG